jgi:acyl transferase domain-containing protein
VGGANLILDPETMISMANFGMLSPDGKCYSFDQRANGYARGEGFGVVIVKRLSDALTDRDTIRAIIRATGANQDGKTAGITHPSGSAQERLIRDTYREAGLALKVTRYFEAHGTGTRTGDPIEASAIAAAFHDQRLQGDPLFIGSVKSNLGHLEGASGIAGLIKTILVLEKGLIPPNIWFDNANSRIQEEDWNIKVHLQPSSSRSLLTGVS